mgnify:CR=1 FL=1
MSDLHLFNNENTLATATQLMTGGGRRDHLSGLGVLRGRELARLSASLFRRARDVPEGARRLPGKERSYNMSKSLKVVAPQKQTTIKSPQLLASKDKEITPKDIVDFVNNHAGQYANVLIQPLDNVNLKDKQPVPFGYNGRPGGTREVIQNWMLRGVKGDFKLSTILNVSAKKVKDKNGKVLFQGGHSKSKPVCLLALLNGGYSPSSKFWGTPYVKLVVQK